MHSCEVGKPWEMEQQGMFLRGWREVWTTPTHTLRPGPCGGQKEGAQKPLTPPPQLRCAFFIRPALQLSSRPMNVQCEERIPLQAPAE